MANVRTFPWEQLPSVSRDDIEARQDLLRWASRWVDLGRVGFVSSRVLKTPIEITPIFDGRRPREMMPALPELDLRCGDASITIGIEASLAAKIAGLVLGHPLTWVDPEWLPDDSVRGAVSAFLLVVLRRVTSTTWPWRVVRPSTPPAKPARPGRGGLWVRVLMGSESFVMSVHADVPRRSFAMNRDDLRALGALPISLPLVAATFVVPTSGLREIVRDDLVAPGETWLLRVSNGLVSGRAHLVAPKGESAMAVEVRGELARGVDLVVAAGPHAASWEPPMTQDSNHENQTGAAEALADAPVVVRVELAAVTLTAQEWADLSPGGVLATGVKLGAPVVLRAGGVAIARGELCELDGEVAVRILERGETDR